MFPLPSSSKKEEGKQNKHTLHSPGRKARKSSSVNGIDGSGRLSAAAGSGSHAEATRSGTGTGSESVPNADRVGAGGGAGGEEEESGSTSEQIERLKETLRVALAETEGGGVGAMEEMDPRRVGGSGYPSRERALGGDGPVSSDDAPEPSGVRCKLGSLNRTLHVREDSKYYHAPLRSCDVWLVHGLLAY